MIDMDVNKFIEFHYKHFNAGALAECSKSLQEFLKNDGRIMITLAGAMSTAEIGKISGSSNSVTENTCNLLYRCKSRRRSI